MAPGESNGHVTGNVTWPWESRSWHQYIGTHYLQYDWRYTSSYDFMWP